MGMGPTQSNNSWTIPAGTEYGFWYRGIDHGNCQINKTGSESFYMIISPTNRHYFDDSELIRDGSWHRWSNITTSSITSYFQVSGTIYNRAEDASCTYMELWMDDFFPSTYSIYFDTPVADFQGTPTSGPAPQLITLTDTSTGGSGTSWNWSGSGPGTMWWGDVSSRNSSVYLSTPGNYTISHGIANDAGSDIETKTDYIWIYNDSSTSSTGCLAISGPTGQRISGAQVDLYDIENSSWSNTTTTMGLGTITTLKGHTINCYASATGFEDGDLLAQPENNLQYYTLPLWPSGGYRNVTEGWVTLYVTVTDLDTGQPIAGATVSGGDNNYGTILNSSAFSLTTNSQGLANVPVLNNTVVYLTAYKAGYTTLTAAVNTGTGSGGDAKVTHWFKLSKGAIAVVPSMTTLPGGGYPTTQRTIDPAGTPDPAGGSSAYSSAKGQQMMDYLAMNGMDLVQLCFLVTVLGLLGIKLGK
jgi:PKD repeat protein